MILNYTKSTCDNANAPYLVLIHGLFGSLENLNVLARGLKDDFHIINIDVINHGKSAHRSQIDYPSMAQDVIDTLDDLHIKTAIFVGHSMGGKIAMQLALSNPQLVDKLVVLDIAPVTYNPRHQDVFAGLNAVDLNKITSRNDADKHMAPHINEIGVRQFLLKSLVKLDMHFAWRFNLRDLIASYSSILATPEGSPYNGPTLFIKGGNSDYITQNHRSDILALFPQSRAKVIAGAGHWLHAEKPVAIIKSINDFVST